MSDECSAQVRYARENHKVAEATLVLADAEPNVLICQQWSLGASPQAPGICRFGPTAW
jgi:hypothetical protein